MVGVIANGDFFQVITNRRHLLQNNINFTTFEYWNLVNVFERFEKFTTIFFMWQKWTKCKKRTDIEKYAARSYKLLFLFFPKCHKHYSISTFYLRAHTNRTPVRFHYKCVHTLHGNLSPNTFSYKGGFKVFALAPQ